MRRIAILSAAGLAAILSAGLYVHTGAAHGMVWTYPRCIEYATEPCPPPQGVGVMTCHHIALTCKRFQIALQPWVYDWLSQSALSTAFVGVVAILVSRGIGVKR
jgi:hypothetical protein